MENYLAKEEGWCEDIILSVVNKEDAKVSYCPHKVVLNDLALIPEHIVRNRTTGEAEALRAVDREEISLFWGNTSEREILALARRNTLKKCEVKFFTPEDIQERLRKHGFPVIPPIPFGAIRMSLEGVNPERDKGARILAFPKIVLEKVRECFGEDCYILPSSIHEIILLPVSRGCECNLFEMVRGANEELLPFGKLSDSVYLADLEEEVVKPLVSTWGKLH
jgi:hypothetical protein